MKYKMSNIKLDKVQEWVKHKITSGAHETLKRVKSKTKNEICFCFKFGLQLRENLNL